MGRSISYKKLLDRIFDVVVFLKFVFGVFNIFAGFLFAISGQRVIDNLAVFVARQEVIENPNDVFLNYLIKLSDNFSLEAQFFAIFYLFSHGLVNIFLVVSLFKNKLWAFPVAIVAFSLFVVYQMYKYLHGYSEVMLLLIIFDLFVITVISLEYRKKLRKLVLKVQA